VGTRRKSVSRRWTWWDWTKHILWIIGRTFVLMLEGLLWLLKWAFIIAGICAFGLLIIVGVWFAHASEANMRQIRRLTDE
jgi:ABC-type bacteriocin/lantibiotic exporter with double-glycine peptidase domain